MFSPPFWAFRPILLFALPTIRSAAQRAIFGGLIIAKLNFVLLSNESKKAPVTAKIN